MLRRRVAAVLVFVVLLPAGCGDDDARKVDAGSEGSTVEIGVGETLQVRLEANPTTGYEWVVLDAGVLELVSQRHRPESDADGSGGVTTLTFSPTGTGTADLTLGYLQPWEEDVEPIETFTITVSVSG